MMGGPGQSVNGARDRMAHHEAERRSQCPCRAAEDVVQAFSRLAMFLPWPGPDPLESHSCVWRSSRSSTIRTSAG
jgi:hypothetical protein